LRCKNVKDLQIELQMMKTLNAEAQYVLACIPQAARTIRINAESLRNRMRIIQNLAKKRGWTMTRK